MIVLVSLIVYAMGTSCMYVCMYLWEDTTWEAMVIGGHTIETHRNWRTDHRARARARARLQ